MADKNLDCPHDKRKDCTVCGHPGMSKTRKHNDGKPVPGPRDGSGH